MLANYFEYWMSFVTFLSAIGFLQAFLSENVLADRQFSLAKRQVTPLTRKFFGAWTLLAAIVRFQCALDSTNVAIWQTTYGTFLLAIALYGYEFLVTKTIPFLHALAPFIVAGVSLVWMTFFS